MRTAKLVFTTSRQETTLAIAFLCVAACWGVYRPATCRSAEADSSVIEMIVELVKNPDRDMRALAFQQIREEVPGEAATKAFCAVLPSLAPDAQSGLLEALGDRGDAVARPAVLKMLEGKEDAVRAAALRALATLASPGEVPILAAKAHAGVGAERDAARQSLVKLRGEAINASLVALLEKEPPGVQVEILRALAGRNARETVSQVSRSAESPDAGVRLAALAALRMLAADKDTPVVVALLGKAHGEEEVRQAEAALLSVCSRGRAACAEAVTAAIPTAPKEAKLVLLRALARAGGDKALDAIVACLNDADSDAQMEAVRLLSQWPDAKATPHLLKLAESTKDVRRSTLAIHGLVRLSSPLQDRPADPVVLAKAMSLATRPQEKRLVLGALGTTSSIEALNLAAASLEDSAVREEAALAAVLVAERLPAADAPKFRAALDKAAKMTKDEKLRQRAEKALKKP